MTTNYFVGEFGRRIATGSFLLHKGEIIMNNGTWCSELLDLGGLLLQEKDLQLNAKMSF
jgi:hypothetical protein